MAPRPVDTHDVLVGVTGHPFPPTHGGFVCPRGVMGLEGFQEILQREVRRQERPVDFGGTSGRGGVGRHKKMHGGKGRNGGGSVENRDLLYVLYRVCGIVWLRLVK